MTYRQLLTKLNEMNKICPDHLDDDVMVAVGEMNKPHLIRNVEQDDGSLYPGQITRYQYVLTEV